MVPQQPLLWVSLDSQGKAGNSARQVSNIKSHCAQYHHQLSRHKSWTASSDLEVPERPSAGIHGRSIAGQFSSPKRQEETACLHRMLGSTVIASDPRIDDTTDSQPEDNCPPVERRRKPQAWRTARCHRFRKQSVSHSPRTELASIPSELLKQLPTMTDSNARDMLKSLYAEEHSSFNRRTLPFDTVRPDPLTFSVNMTSFLSRAAFLLASPGNSPSPSDEDSSPIRRSLDLYKLSAIAIIRERLNDFTSIHDQNTFLAIVTLADCEFMANNALGGRLHLEACLEITQARGGLASLSDLELELMCLAEFEIAALSGGKPCTPLLEMEVAIYSKTAKLSTVTVWTNSGFAKLGFLRTKQASHIREGLASLLHTTNEINRPTSGTPKPQEHESILLRGLFAGLQLCCAPQSSAEAAGVTAIEASFCESLRLAGMLVAATTHLKNRPKDHLFDRLTGDMMLHLQGIHISPSLPHSCLLALLWIFCIGAYGASASSKQTFYLHGIAHLAQLLHLETWIGVRAQLCRFLYVESDFDGAFDEIWNSSMFWTGLEP